MQQTSSTSAPFIENYQILPMSTTTTISDVSTSNDTHYSSILFKKKLAMLDHPSTDIHISNDTMNNVNPVSVRFQIFFFCFIVKDQSLTIV